MRVVGATVRGVGGSHAVIHPQIPAVGNVGVVVTAEAEPLYRRALAIRERVFGPDHPEVSTSLNNLANLLTASGEVIHSGLGDG